MAHYGAARDQGARCRQTSRREPHWSAAHDNLGHPRVDGSIEPYRVDESRHERADATLLRVTFDLTPKSDGNRKESISRHVYTIAVALQRHVRSAGSDHAKIDVECGPLSDRRYVAPKRSAAGSAVVSVNRLRR